MRALKKLPISQIVVNKELRLTFRRIFSPRMMHTLEELLVVVEQVNLFLKMRQELSHSLKEKKTIEP
jgi:hypothetical protein